MTRSEARRLAATTTLEAAHEMAAAVLKPRRRKVLSLPGRTREERRRTKQQARHATRPLVEARENGRCAVAAIGGCRGALHWDHFFGRGKVPPSVELEWMLCEEHDHQKTESIEGKGHSRLYWLRLFQMHAQFYGYEDALRRVAGKIAIEEAQHHG